MNKPQEVWVMIPEANDRFQVSNLGHVQQLGWMRNSNGNAMPILRVEAMPLSCELETGRLGWRLDDGKFRARDDLMALFDVNSVSVSVDRTRDEQLAREREALNGRQAAAPDIGDVAYRPDRFVMPSAVELITDQSIAALIPDGQGYFKTEFTAIVAENFGISKPSAYELIDRALKSGALKATVQPKRCRWHKAGILITRGRK